MIRARSIVFFYLITFIACNHKEAVPYNLSDGSGWEILESTREIFPGLTTDHDQFLRRGWDRAESEAAWISDRIARLVFYNVSSNDRTIQISARSLPSLDPPQVITIDVNGKPLDEFLLSGDSKTYTANLSNSILKEGWNVMSIACSRIDRPVDLGINRDTRKLGAFVSVIRFLSEGSVESSRKPVSSEKDQGIRVEPDCAVQWIGSTKNKLDLRLSLRTETAGNHEDLWGRFRLDCIQDSQATLLNESGVLEGNEVVMERSISPSDAHPLRIRLVNTGAAPILVKAGAKGLQQAIEETSEPPSEFKTGTNQSVFLFVMDACDREALGAYGNPYINTPFLDRVSRSGWTFFRAYSTASYTVSSVATILTGLSFWKHGITQIGDVVSHEAGSLAKSFKSKGYKTIAISCMPTVSARWGFSEGFDRFIELVSENSPVVNIENLQPVIPELLTEINDKPIFCYFHIREPHAPYNVPHPLNSYLGPTDSSTGEISILESMDRLLADGNPLTEEMKNRISSSERLYFSQLSRLDSELSRIVIQLISHPQVNENSKFIFASDHGEAFGQHGRLMHNSTVYSEMIRVPLIVWDSSDKKSIPGITADPISVGQLKTMLLDLHTKDRSLSSLLCHRSAGTSACYTGIISGNWHYIEGGYYPSQVLFDLESDPGELKDLSQSLPVRTDLLRKILADHRNRESTLRNDAPNPPMDDNVKSQLKSLGYFE